MLPDLLPPPLRANEPLFPWQFAQEKLPPLEGVLKDLPKLWDDRWFIPLPFTEPFELLNVLLPLELTLWLKIEEAAFLVDLESNAVACETRVELCDTGSTLVTAWVLGSMKWLEIRWR